MSDLIAMIEQFETDHAGWETNMSGFGTLQAPASNVFIGYNFFIDRGSIMKLVAAVNSYVQRRSLSITLCISSNGGSTEQAFYAYEILRALPVPIHSINLGIIQSAANVLFMAGETRTAVPGAHFLFHQTKFSPQTGGNYVPADLAFSTASIKMDDARTAAIMSDRTGKPLADVKKWFSGERLRTTKFAIANGIIKEVKPLVMPIGSEFFQVTL